MTPHPGGPTLCPPFPCPHPITPVEHNIQLWHDRHLERRRALRATPLLVAADSSDTLVSTHYSLNAGSNTTVATPVVGRGCRKSCTVYTLPDLREIARVGSIIPIPYFSRTLHTVRRCVKWVRQCQPGYDTGTTYI